MKEHWNFHGYIAVPLEHYRREYLGGEEQDADCISQGKFAGTMITILKTICGNTTNVQDFCSRCRKYIGKWASEIPEEDAKELFDEFKELVGK